MQRPQPMNRLLQGDVGSGKTIVALMAALVAIENGLQVAFMAPTEILAEQHFFNIRRLLETRGSGVALLTGGRPRKSAARCSRELAGGSLQWCRHARARSGRRGVSRAGAGRDRRTASLRRPAARDAADEGARIRRARHDGHADSADARADHLRRPRRVGDARDAARPPGDATTARPESRREESTSSSGSRSPRVGRLCHLSARRGVREGGSEGRDGDGRPPVAGHLSRTAGRAAARTDEARREGPRHGRIRAGRLASPRLDHRGGSRRRRAERHGDAHRTRRALRLVAAPSAARAGRPRRAPSRTASCRTSPRSRRRPARGSRR